MKKLLVLFLTLIGCLACREPTDRTNASASSDSEDSRVTVQWPESREAIEIPLEFLDDIPVIRCQLNGKESVLYVDTACQPICLYEDRLAKFGLKVTAEKDFPRYTALGHVERTSFSSGFVLTFKGGLSMQVSAAPCLSGGGREPSHDVDGILGVKIVKALNGVLDLRAQKLILSVERKPKTAQRTGASRIAEETNQTSSAAGSRR